MIDAMPSIEVYLNIIPLSKVSFKEVLPVLPAILGSISDNAETTK